MTTAQSALRPRLIDTVERLDWKVTLGDIASQTGLALGTARQELLSLAQDGQGSLQVSDTGDILYVFPRRIRQILEDKVQKDQWAQRRQKLWRWALQVFRMSFGVFLIAEFVLIVVAIFLLMTAANKDSDNRRSRSGPSFFWFPNFWYGNPFFGGYGYPGTHRPRPQRRAKASQDEEGMNFLDAVYSFLFGDGDPNPTLEEDRLKLIGQVIRQNNGVIVAEQVLPYLDVPSERLPEREDYMVPILLAFDGIPEVNDNGDIVYRFPELQVTGQQRETQRSQPAFLREKPWIFSEAGSGQLSLAMAFGLFNFVGAWWLEIFARPTLLAIGGLGALIANLLWLMVIFGTFFLVVPGIRWFTLQRRNQQVEARNQWRQAWRDLLQNPSDELVAKVSALRNLGKREVVDDRKIIYRSDQDVLEQGDPELNHPQWQALQDEQPR